MTAVDWCDVVRVSLMWVLVTWLLVGFKSLWVLLYCCFRPCLIAALLAVA